MKLTKEQAKELFKDYPSALARIDKIQGDIYFDLQSKTVYKSNKQNNLFHSLLECFWESGCSSFGNYDDLRNYYKRIAGLVKKQGSVVVESSWSDAKKEQARTAIDMCIRDMDFSGVMGSSKASKYTEILKGIKLYYEILEN
jgi:hypothetical protein